jgi:hypothetical protein
MFDSAQGRPDMQDVVTAAKAVTASTATGAGILMWAGAVLPIYIQFFTAFTLTCTAVVFVYRFVNWVRGKSRKDK